jgi:hypothetical protein
MKRYSRLAFVEERRNIKKAYLYVFLSILALIFLLYLGLPTLIKFAGFVGDIAKSDKPIEFQDTTPPAPPQFDEIPEYSKEESIDVTGTSENGATVSITANNNTSEVVANSDGRFIFLFNLMDGENTISATAKDISGNLSTESKFFKVTFDNTEPNLEITSPKDADSFYSSSQRQLSIKGTVNEMVDIRVNDRFVSLNEDGTFNFTTTLNEGVNLFEIKATDPAGNQASTSLSVNFTP